MKNRKIKKYFLLYMVLCLPKVSLGHDTTHIHPLITLEIAKTIRSIDHDTTGVDAYLEIYEQNPDFINNPVLPKENQFLYWGTDFDPVGLNN